MVIDCHAHHIALPFNTNYLEWMDRTGRRDFGPPYLWDNPAFENTGYRYREMDKAGISCFLNTYSANITQIIDAASEGREKIKAVRQLNDCAIALCRQSGGRMMTTALVDLRLGIPALEEMNRCGSQVKGYSVLAAYSLGGQIRFLEDPLFEGFWAEAEKAGKPIFIHFSNLYKINNPEAPLTGFMNDTLLYAGMGQLGGMYPFMLERIEMLYTMYELGAQKAQRCVTDPRFPERFMRNMKNYTENIYVDTHSMDPQSIACAAETLGPDKILFGTDYPVTPSAWGMRHALESMGQLPVQLRKMVLEGNARRLLQI